MRRLLKNWRWVITGGLIFCLATAIITLWVNRVTNDITPTDAKFIAAFMKGKSSGSVSNPYDQQIDFIKNVQDAVLTRAPLGDGIPFNQTREPEDLFNAQHGLCFDRSRVIEKILRSNGFETRHIFAYSIKDRNFRAK